MSPRSFLTFLYVLFGIDLALGGPEYKQMYTSLGSPVGSYAADLRCLKRNWGLWCASLAPRYRARPSEYVCLHKDYPIHWVSRQFRVPWPGTPVHLNPSKANSSQPKRCQDSITPDESPTGYRPMYKEIHSHNNSYKKVLHRETLPPTPPFPPLSSSLLLNNMLPKRTRNTFPPTPISSSLHPSSA